jgi:hypothetical protein
MKVGFLLFLFCFFSYHALATDSARSPEEKSFQSLLRESEAAYALATAHLGAFKDSRLNALTNRIQDDERVIQKALRDTARLRGFKLPVKEAVIPGEVSSPEDYLRRQVELHAKILAGLEKNSFPVLKNIQPRVERTSMNAKKLRKEFIEAEEESM